MQWDHLPFYPCVPPYGWGLRISRSHNLNARWLAARGQRRRGGQAPQAVSRLSVYKRLLTCQIIDQPRSSLTLNAHSHFQPRPYAYAIALAVRFELSKGVYLFVDYLFYISIRMSSESSSRINTSSSRDPAQSRQRWTTLRLNLFRKTRWSLDMPIMIITNMTINTTGPNTPLLPYYNFFSNIACLSGTYFSIAVVLSLLQPLFQDLFWR